MINALLRVVRRVRKLCVDCGVAPEDGARRCHACSLTQVADFDNTDTPEVEVPFEGPAYFDLHLVEDPIDYPKIGSAADKF